MLISQTFVPNQQIEINEGALFTQNAVNQSTESFASFHEKKNIAAEAEDFDDSTQVLKNSVF